MKRIIFITTLIFLTGAVINGQKVVDFLMEGKALTDAGRHDDAITVITLALEKEINVKLYLQRAEIYLGKGDYSGAISDFNEANRIAPSSGEYGLARIYSIKGDETTALHHLEMNLKSHYKKSEKQIMLDPAFTVIENKPAWRQFWQKSWYNRYEETISQIEYYTSAGKPEDAKLLLADLKRDYSGMESNSYAEALISISSKDYSGALKAVSDLISISPDKENYLYIMAQAQEGTGNFAGASTSYTKLMDLGTADAELLLKRAECYSKTGEINKAIADIEKFLRFYPEDKKALSFAGRIETARGNKIKAFEYFSENLRIHPNDADCYIDRANAYFTSKSWEWAIKDYSMSLDLVPDNADVWLSKGISLLNTGRVHEACHDFKKSFSLGNKKAVEYIGRNCLK